ncbi:MAG: hypothetical protein KJP23_29805 [Deltaproteobacteria bacterium]|nr:hypothetical protein [Deltaproteobacteria bacterium]
MIEIPYITPASNDWKNFIFSNSRPAQTIAEIQPKNMVSCISFRMTVFRLSKKRANEQHLTGIFNIAANTTTYLTCLKSIRKLLGKITIQ